MTKPFLSLFSSTALQTGLVQSAGSAWGRTSLLGDRDQSDTANTSTSQQELAEFSHALQGLASLQIVCSLFVCVCMCVCSRLFIIYIINYCSCLGVCMYSIGMCMPACSCVCVCGGVCLSVCVSGGMSVCVCLFVCGGVCLSVCVCRIL